MKVISVIGISSSGKTTTIENIIKELKSRNYSVGTVKEIHFEEFKMDQEGTNTDRHRKAGAELVSARGYYETDIMYPERLDINKLLSFYNQDYVILEGVRDTNVPKILTALDIPGIDDRINENIFAISGRISEQLTEYKGLPAINSMTDIVSLVDLIEEKAFDTKLDDKEKTGMLLKINDNEIPLKPYIENMLINTIEAIVKELKGYDGNGDIEICIKR